MGIWVRSQNNIILCFATEMWVNGEKVMANDGMLLGSYKTKAEAIKVLDAIEGIIGEVTAIRMPAAGFSKAGDTAK